MSPKFRSIGEALFYIDQETDEQLPSRFESVDEALDWIEQVTGERPPAPPGSTGPVILNSGEPGERGWTNYAPITDND